jgi:hypothetical protein
MPTPIADALDGLDQGEPGLARDGRAGPGLEVKFHFLASAIESVKTENQIAMCSHAGQ